MKRLIFALFLISGWLGVITSVSAENGHAYNGSYCDNYYGSQAGSFNHQHNGIRNNDAAGRYVSCPVIVDEIANTNGTTRVWVHYSGNGTVRCTMFNKNPNGSTRQSRSGSRVNSGWFSIPTFSSDNYWGSYSMYCYLPSKGMLNTIWVGEKN